MKFPILPLRAVMVPSIDLSCIVFGVLIVDGMSEYNLDAIN